MGQKVNPNSFRLQVNKNWKSRWYARPQDYANFLHEDIKIRDYIQKDLGGRFGIARVDIERDANMVTIIIHTSRPGVIIGRGGAGVSELRKNLSKLVKSRIKDVNIEEIRKPDLNAKVMADSCKEQLEKRIAFKRVGKQAIEKIIRAGAKGAKVTISGRLNGAEIARSQSFQEGKIPMSTLRADVDYGFSEANTTYGILGIKVWIYKGESSEELNRNSSQDSN
ncbi:MAG: 30S ribosomal protein S3 [Patescibacteria group bacterium]|nr:30S ribosomal protein S3 [Patescibacteria group bacterium]